MSDSKYKYSGNQGLLEELEELKQELAKKQAALKQYEGDDIPMLEPSEQELPTLGEPVEAAEDDGIPELEAFEEPQQSGQGSLFPPNPDNTLSEMRAIDPKAPRYDKNNNPFLSKKTIDRLAQSRKATHEELEALLNAAGTANSQSKQYDDTIERLVDDIVEGAIPLLRRQLRAQVREMIKSEMKKQP